MYRDEHIAEEAFYPWVFDRTAPNASERSHLDACSVCRAQLAAIQQLAHELQIALASTPSTTALARYTQLYAQVAQAPSLTQRLSDFITATLQWDGRQQLAWQGVRNISAASYRLLYTTDQAEIELLVAPHEDGFAVEGEIIPLQEPTTLLPVRCELQSAPSGETIALAESQTNGRFRLRDIPAAHYRLFFTPQHGSIILIDNLELL